MIKNKAESGEREAVGICPLPELTTEHGTLSYTIPPFPKEPQHGH